MMLTMSCVSVVLGKIVYLRAPLTVQRRRYDNLWGKDCVLSTIDEAPLPLSIAVVV